MYIMINDLNPPQVVDIMTSKPKFAIPYLPEDRPFIVVSNDTLKKEVIQID